MTGTNSQSPTSRALTWIQCKLGMQYMRNKVTLPWESNTVSVGLKRRVAIRHYIQVLHILKYIPMCVLQIVYSILYCILQTLHMFHVSYCTLNFLEYGIPTVNANFEYCTQQWHLLELTNIHQNGQSELDSYRKAEIQPQYRQILG